MSVDLGHRLEALRLGMLADIEERRSVFRSYEQGRYRQYEEDVAAARDADVVTADPVNIDRLIAAVRKVMADDEDLSMMPFCYETVNRVREEMRKMDLAETRTILVEGAGTEHEFVEMPLRCPGFEFRTPSPAPQKAGYYYACLKFGMNTQVQIVEFANGRVYTMGAFKTYDAEAFVWLGPVREVRVSEMDEVG